MRVIVVGIPGVGKSTVMEEAARRLNYEVVNFGTVMFEIAREGGLVEHRDEMRKLPIGIQQEIQREAAERIASMDNVMVDTHMLIRTPGGYMPGLPQPILMALRPDRIIVIEADPEEILQRRAGDEGRRRDADDVNTIREHLEMTRVAAIASSILTRASVCIVRNPQNGVDRAVNAVLEAMKG